MDKLDKVKQSFQTKKKKKKFIRGAIKHPGALTKSAKATGESPMEFAREHKHNSGVTGSRARAAIILQGFHK